MVVSQVYVQWTRKSYTLMYSAGQKFENTPWEYYCNLFAVVHPRTKILLTCSLFCLFLPIAKWRKSKQLKYIFKWAIFNAEISFTTAVKHILMLL